MGFLESGNYFVDCWTEAGKHRAVQWAEAGKHQAYFETGKYSALYLAVIGRHQSAEPPEAGQYLDELEAEAARNLHSEAETAVLVLWS